MNLSYNPRIVTCLRYILCISAEGFAVLSTYVTERPYDVLPRYTRINHKVAVVLQIIKIVPEHYFADLDKITFMFLPIILTISACVTIERKTFIIKIIH